MKKPITLYLVLLFIFLRGFNTIGQTIITEEHPDNINTTTFCAGATWYMYVSVSPAQIASYACNSTVYCRVTGTNGYVNNNFPINTHVAMPALGAGAVTFNAVGYCVSNQVFSISRNLNSYVGTYITTLSASPSIAPCVGSTLNLTSSSHTGATYAWTGPNGFTSTSQNPTITNFQTVNSGVYSLTVTAPNGCITSPVTINIVSPSPVISSAITVNDNTPCIGSTVSLNAPTITGSTYLWSGPNGFTSTLQNPSISNIQTTGTGTYSLVVTNTASGCSSITSANSSVLVYVQTLPDLSSFIPLSDNTPCLGSTVSFTAPTLAGCTYSWSGPNGFTSTSQNPSISNIQTTGTGTYTLVVTNPATGCNSTSTGTSSVVVTVQTLPVIATAVSVDDNTPCVGTALNLTSAAVAGCTYAWSGPNGFTSTSQNPNISNIQVDGSGTYSLNLISTTTGCSSLPSSVVVTVQTLPTIELLFPLSDDTPCVGSTVSFNAPIMASTTYSWSGPNGFTSSLPSPSISNVQPVNNGTYSLIITNTTSGCSSIASANSSASIIVNSPVVTTSVIDGAIISDMQFSTGCTYQWIDCSNNGLLSGEHNQSFTPLSNGNYAVIISYDGCIDTSNCVAINDVGITEIKEFEVLLIYPNPSKGYFSIESENMTSVEILNLLGEKIKDLDLNSGKNTLDLTNNISGVYFLKNSHTNQVFKLVKE